MMTAQDQHNKERIETQLSELYAALIGEQGREIWDRLESSHLRDLLSVLIKIYAQKVKNGEQIEPVSKTQLNATESVVFADHLTQFMEIELFEIQIWRTLGSNY
jgi:hypothetical protein